MFAPVRDPLPEPVPILHGSVRHIPRPGICRDLASQQLHGRAPLAAMDDPLTQTVFMAFSVDRRNFGRQRIYPLSHNDLGRLSENELILLANLFQPYKTEISAEVSPLFCAFKEVICKAKFRSFRVHQ